MPTLSVNVHTMPVQGCRRGMAGKALRLPRLPALREERFLSQMELAKRAGLARSTLARIEGGEAARLGTIRRLAEALGVTPAELVRE